MGKRKLYVFYTLLYLILLLTFFISKIIMIESSYFMLFLVIYPGIIAFYMSKKEKVKLKK